MDYSKIGVRYAKALFEYSEEENALEVVVNDMREMSKIIKTEADFVNYLGSPIVLPSDKMKFVDKVFGSKFHKISIDFLYLLIKQKREKHLNAICRKIESMYKEKHGVRSLEMVTAQDVNDDIKRKIQSIVKDALNAKSLDVVEVVDPNIIGGFVLKMEDLQYDASVKTQLETLKLQLK
jgi:F-type H+-transporting ATPase subunit delta